MVAEKDIEILLSILGTREKHCILAKNHRNNEVDRQWLDSSEVIDYVSRMNGSGFQVWISVYDKELDNDTNEGVKSVDKLFFDIDPDRPNKAIVATNEERRKALEEALKLERYFKEKFDAQSFIACSGNGWYLILPFERVELPDKKIRLQMALKLKAFCKEVSANSKVKIDHTYDLRRLMGVIGSPNLKLPDEPLQTSWYNLEVKSFDVESARKHNRELLEALLNVQEIEEKTIDPEELRESQEKAHKLISELVETDEKLRVLCREDFDVIQKRYGYPTRSEAEMALLCKLVKYGFSDIDIYDIMDGTQIGSWHERNNTYKPKQIQKAREFIANPKNNEDEIWKLAKNPHLFTHILIDLEGRVKKDIPSKCTAILTDMSAYHDKPLTTSLKGISGVGKTHNVIEASLYFPEEDIMYLGGLSPKALIHQHGILMDDENRPILPEDKPERPLRRRFQRGDEGTQEYDEACQHYRTEIDAWNTRIHNSYRLIKLSNKIIIFLESPSEETYRMLFPILSHDVERIEYKWVEDMITKTAIIQGFPAVTFLSTEQKYMEELSTRSLTVTPESEEGKIKDAMKLSNIQAAFPWKYEGESGSTKMIREVILCIRDKFIEENYGVDIPFTNLYEVFSSEIVRDMRDFKHFLRFLKALTMFYVFQRPILKTEGRSYVLSSIDDVIMALCMYSQIYETTRTGIEADILKFYNDIVMNQTSWYLSDLVEKYNEVHKKKVSSKSVGAWLRMLYDIDHVDIQKDTLDKRKNIYVPMITEKEKVQIVLNLENRSILRSKLEINFKEWIKNVPSKSEFSKYRFSNGEMQLVRMELRYVEDTIKESSFLEIPKEKGTIYLELGVLKSEKKAKIVPSLQNRTIGTISKEKCDCCGHVIEGGLERVGEYKICSECSHDYTIRGYREDDIIKELKFRTAWCKDKNTEKAEETGDEEFGEWVRRIWNKKEGDRNEFL